MDGWEKKGGRVGEERWTGGRRKVDGWEKKGGRAGEERWTGGRRNVCNE
jgi:hypothetical protein